MTDRVRVTTGARLHFGFANLSLAHDRLYGALGAALASPQTVVSAAPADAVLSDHGRAARFGEHVCDLLGLDGAVIDVETALPRHVGLGSGTALALAVLTAVAKAHGRAPAVRQFAPALGRGGRSGVGVGLFEGGGLVLDGGHPTDRFTTETPDPGSWTVPRVVARHQLPADWRFLLVRPAVEPGLSDTAEDDRMRAVIRAADPEPANRIAGVIVRRLLPAVATGDVAEFGTAVEAIGRHNGGWYAGEQGGVYRPPAGRIVDTLREVPAVSGVGQSSWGPTVYGVTDVDRADAARDAGRGALDAADVDGTVSVVAARNRGATVERL